MIVDTEKWFNETIEKGGVVVVDFYADWCGPCKAMAPIFHALAEKYADKATFLKVNVDTLEGIASDYKVRGIPTIVFFKNGMDVAKLVGNQPADKIEQAITDVLAAE